MNTMHEFHEPELPDTNPDLDHMAMNDMNSFPEEEDDSQSLLEDQPLMEDIEDDFSMDMMDDHDLPAEEENQLDDQIL
jgi:hypothetical protein